VIDDRAFATKHYGRRPLEMIRNTCVHRCRRCIADGAEGYLRTAGPSSSAPTRRTRFHHRGLRFRSSPMYVVRRRRLRDPYGAGRVGSRPDALTARCLFARIAGWFGGGRRCWLRGRKTLQNDNADRRRRRGTAVRRGTRLRQRRQAGSTLNLATLWLSTPHVKETFVPPRRNTYPHMGLRWIERSPDETCPQT